MTPNPFTTPSLAATFFASAGGAALLSACLDMRAALANLDEGNDDDDATDAKQRFDDLTDMLVEAGVPVVISAPASAETGAASEPDTHPVFKLDCFSEERMTDEDMADALESLAGMIRDGYTSGDANGLGWWSVSNLTDAEDMPRDDDED